MKNSREPRALVDRGVVAASRGLVLSLLAAVSIWGAAASCSKNTTTGPQPGTGGEGGGDVPLDARNFYIERVHPEIVISCGVCHTSTANCVPQFMEDNASQSYERIKNYVRAEDGSPGGLVTYADNSNLIFHSAHTGPALSEPQEALVREWLDLEMNGQEAPSPSLSESLHEIGQCMRLAALKQAFNDDQVYLLAHQGSEHGPCGSCHNTGQAGAWIGYNVDEMQEQNSKLPWIKRLVQPYYAGDDEFAGLAASNRFVRKVEDAAACGSTHPAALVRDDIAAGIDNYVQDALDRWEAGPCDTE
jgi:hypothetical protein